MPKTENRPAPHPYHIREADIPWTDYSDVYPDDMMARMRAKRIVGPGGAIESHETVFGTLEIDSGAEYPSHRHAAPEVYYVLEGEAECVWGNESFTVGPGSVIRTPPGVWHSIRNIGSGRFYAVAYWWAPGGDRDVLRAPLELMALD